MSGMRWISVARAVALVHVFAVFVSSCGGGGPPSAAAPAVTRQPAPVRVVEGESASFSISAGGTLPLTYQWQRNGQDIAGATGLALIVEHVAISESGTQYRVVVSNAAGSVTSISAELTVVPPQVAIDQQPTPVDAKEGATATLRVHATGSGTLRHQWFRAGHPIAGGTGASLTIGPLRYGDDVDYTVEVSNDLSTMTSSPAAVRISPASPAQPLSGCTEITTPGGYLLTADILPTSRNTTCVYVHDTHDVQIDCAGHKLAGTLDSDAIKIEHVAYYSLRNCNIDTGRFDISSTIWGSISNNFLVSTSFAMPSTTVHAWNANHIVFANNTLSGSYDERYAESGTISNNQVFGVNVITGPGGILAAYSKHTRIFGNTIDGAWDGTTRGGGSLPLGLDDGIVVADLSDVVIENNVMRNVWDCGIEWTGSISDSTIQGNRTEKAGVCAIGGWYWSSVSNVQFVNNKASDVQRMFYMYRRYGLRPAGTDLEGAAPADTEASFRDNIFDGNVLLSPFNNSLASTIFIYSKMGYAGDTSSIWGERLIPDDAFKIGNNIFRNNDFGYGVPGPDFNGLGAPGIVIDGGGNKCVKPASVDYPLKCN